MKHFKLTTETKVSMLGVTLFRIEAVIDSKWANKGDKGGFVEKESNLSGNAWVYGNAEVYGNARVYGDAEVYGNAKSTRKVFTLNFVHNLTMTDFHIRYGCEQKTIEEWSDWLESSGEFETPRSSSKFNLIEMSLKLAIEQSKLLK